MCGSPTFVLVIINCLFKSLTFILQRSNMVIDFLAPLLADLVKLAIKA
jgi:hypothetical protein